MDSPNDGPNSSANPVYSDGDLAPLMAKIIRAKQERRAALARLPFEQKIRIVVELQKIANEIRANSGRNTPRVWDIPST